MQSMVWRDLIARIPPKQHDKLVVVTNVGIEITAQEIIRMEDDFLVIRGRISGTSDTGRLFFVPFDQITYVGILKALLESEIAEIVGAPGPQPTAAAAPGPPIATAPAAPEPQALDVEPEVEEIEPHEMER